MLTVIEKGGLGYAATSDLSEAVARARHWASLCRENMIIDFSKLSMPQGQGEYHSKVEKPWDSVSIAEKLDLLQTESVQCQLNDKIVDWHTQLVQEGGNIDTIEPIQGQPLGHCPYNIIFFVGAILYGCPCYGLGISALLYSMPLS